LPEVDSTGSAGESVSVAWDPLTGRPALSLAAPWQPKIQHRLRIVHATLHTSIRSVPVVLTTTVILEKIRLIERFLRDVGTPTARIAVCALNPHAGEEGLFGEEEIRTIAPAVRAAAEEGIFVVGPLPADTVLKRAAQG